MQSDIIMKMFCEIPQLADNFCKLFCQIHELD